MFDFKKEIIESIDLSFAADICIAAKDDLLSNCSTEAYKLYAYLSSQYDNITILDVGTYNGNSALALSYNEKNNVISYDIAEFGASNIPKNNIIWKIKDFRDDKSIDFDKVKIILIDVDPHDGKQEVEMIDFLRRVKWSGILLFDDIHLNDDMKKIWNIFPEHIRIDLTEVGHHSGTGMVIFN